MNSGPAAFLRAAKLGLAIAVILACLGCVHTRPFRGAEGNILPGSIALMEMASIGGMEQSLWFRGEDRGNPALILLHGGPGTSESALFRHYNADLERRFLMVYWEQRGTGRSYHAGLPPGTMTIAQLLRDLDEVVDLVRRRFRKEKVILLGHSWGTVLGTIYASRHPEKVMAYIGVAQIADVPEGHRVSQEFALGEAIKRDNARAVAALEKIGPRPGSADQMLELGTWVERFGGTFHRGTFHRGLSTGSLIRTALKTDEANLVDLVRFGQGNRFSLDHLWDEFSTMKLSDRYLDFQVPVFFLLGRHDQSVPSELAERYFRAIRAPCKQLVWFEHSAHNPPFEEPQRFNRVVEETGALAGAGRIGDTAGNRGCSTFRHDLPVTFGKISPLTGGGS